MVTDLYTLSEAGNRALALAVRHVNASTLSPLGEQELLRLLRSGKVPSNRREQLRAFIDETDTATLQDLVLSRAATYDELSALAGRLLPVTHDTRRWLDERTAH